MIRAMSLAAVLFLPSISLASPRDYRVKFLPLPPSQTESAAYSLNESGDVVGYVVLGSVIAPHPFVYDAGTGATTVFSATGHAYDINESGLLTGRINSRPFISDGFHVTTFKISSTGQSRGIGLAINDAGHISGWVEGPEPNVAFLYDGSSVTTLTEIGETRSSGTGINNSGAVVGSASAELVNTHALLYENGTLTNLAESNPEIQYSAAIDINDSGLIVGEATDPATGFLSAGAFTNGMVQLLGSLSDGALKRDAGALGVNDLGTIVGRSGVEQLTAGDTHGFIYVDGAMFDLNDYLRTPGDYYIHDAWEINNQGQIAGTARLPNGQFRAVVLTPVPEPSTWALAAIGLVSMSVVRHRSRAGGAKS